MDRRQFVVRTVCGACAGLLYGEWPAAALAAGGTVTVGPLSNFKREGVSSTWVGEHGFFLVRDKDRLFAPSAACTHRKSVRLTTGSNGTFVCPKHGAAFDADGTVTRGPAQRSLMRYAIRLDARKNVVVDLSRSFEQSGWDDPASCIRIK